MTRSATGQALDAKLWTVSTLSSGSAQVAAGQSSSGILVTNSGTLNVLSSGTASAIVVSAGGIENVFGIDTGATINDGGFQIVFSGGVP